MSGTLRGVSGFPQDATPLMAAHIEISKLPRFLELAAEHAALVRRVDPRGRRPEAREHVDVVVNEHERGDAPPSPGSREDRHQSRRAPSGSMKCRPSQSATGSSTGRRSISRSSASRCADYIGAVSETPTPSTERSWGRLRANPPNSSGRPRGRRPHRTRSRSHAPNSRSPVTCCSRDRMLAKEPGLYTPEGGPRLSAGGALSPPSLCAVVPGPAPRQCRPGRHRAWILGATQELADPAQLGIVQFAGGMRLLEVRDHVVLGDRLLLGDLELEPEDERHAHDDGDHHQDQGEHGLPLPAQQDQRIRCDRRHVSDCSPEYPG